MSADRCLLDRALVAEVIEVLEYYETFEPVSRVYRKLRRVKTLLAAAPAAPAAEPEQPVPEGWATQAMQEIYTAARGAPITDDMKRAAGLALRVMRGERWDEKLGRWSAPGAAPAAESPEPLTMLTDEQIEDMLPLGESLPDGFDRWGHELTATFYRQQDMLTISRAAIAEFCRVNGIGSKP